MEKKPHVESSKATSMMTMIGKSAYLVAGVKNVKLSLKLHTNNTLNVTRIEDE